MSVTFTVHGTPAPQGSKTRTRWGIREDNPNTKPWRATVAADAAQAMQGLEPFTGPLALNVVFYFPRPKSHFRTGAHADQLKPTAPAFHTGKPDADKLLRAIGDALTGIVVRDDSHFAVVRAEKVYGQPRALIHVHAITKEAA